MVKTESNGKKRETSMVLDLSDFVTEVDRFSRLIEPFALAFYLIDDLRRWRFRYSTVGVWLLFNAACIFLSQGVIFVLASSLVIAVASLALIQVHTQILEKVLPNNRRPVKPTTFEDEPSHLETVENFRYSLIEMHDFVMKSNEYLAYFYSILKWDAVVPSLIYHIEACVMLLALVMCPARWNCFLFINWFFLCHPHVLKKCFRYLKEYISTHEPSASKESVAEKEKKAISSKDEDIDKDNCDDIDKDDDSSDLDMTDEVSDTSMIGLDPSPSKPGMVARLMEIKKRRKQIASESCQACNVSFASILKKRCYCRHCGYSFCSRCCYQQVPRSVFGATSPAAMKETVLVCCSCHAVLVTQEHVDASPSVPQQAP
ncbi:Zinc finger fyve domain-containing protein 27 [Plakobranchus ocellatus]|uniref:Protrudin n=1 Tax=Plakobranchus ocellatus TaxID=259542 RepID=A0AAV4CXB7_9GAST|nr:Zinc finger fyve domain-containing protein 27 [Plakobranchus ocellatus]